MIGDRTFVSILLLISLLPRPSGSNESHIKLTHQCIMKSFNHMWSASLCPEVDLPGDGPRIAGSQQQPD